MDTPLDFLPEPDREFRARSFPEDYEADPDRGGYSCRCHHCKKGFVGYKRRVTCKLCEPSCTIPYLPGETFREYIDRRVAEGTLDLDAVAEAFRSMRACTPIDPSRIPRTHEEADDLVDEWHEGGSGMPLSAYMGLTPEQYSRWVESCDLPEAPCPRPSPH